MMTEKFMPGEVVKVKDLDSPEMKVVRLVVLRDFIKKQQPNKLYGVECFWFTVNNEYQKAIFNTKDLFKVSK